jgi:mRNA interferase YafQ
MYSLETTNRYLKDLKLARKQNFNETELDNVIKLLLDGKILPVKYRDHKLTGNYKGLNECHITPDWLLIYQKDTVLKLITLIRTGTHSDLFE